MPDSGWLALQKAVAWQGKWPARVLLLGIRDFAQDVVQEKHAMGHVVVHEHRSPSKQPKNLDDSARIFSTMSLHGKLAVVYSWMI